MGALRAAALAIVAAILASGASAQDAALPDETPPGLHEPPAPPADPSEAARNAEFARVLDEVYATGDFAGLAVALVRRGDTVFVKTYGTRAAGSADPVTPQTVFRIASLSKGVTGTLAALAMVEGRLSVDEPIAPYAPGFRLQGEAHRELTIADVLSHRTGLPSHAYDNLLLAGVPVDDILPRFYQLRLTCEVGACYNYQNITFDFAGLALSSAYELPFESLAKQKIFEPLGMATASIGEAALYASPDWARPARRAKTGKGRYAYGPWRTVAVKPAFYRVPSSGGVNASILDLAQWLKGQSGHAKTIPAAALDLAHVVQVASPVEDPGMRNISPRFSNSRYGYGWRRYDYAGADVIGHGGIVDGYGAQIAWLPDRDVGIVLLTNSQSRRFWRILPTFLDLELGLDRGNWLDLAPVIAPVIAATPAPPAPAAE